MASLVNLNTCTENVSSHPESVNDEWRRNLGQSKLHLGATRTHDWWTGLRPADCPGFSSNGKLHSLTIPNLATCSRKEVRDYFNNSWTLTELLFTSLIGDEPFYRPPYHALRHPLVFYYVHPAVLYINKLRLSGLVQDQISAFYESLFETGVDEMSWDDMSKNFIKWPSLDDCLKYRKQVYDLVLALIESHPDLADGHAPITKEHPLWALFMGFEHERIHLETSSVLIRELPIHLVHSPKEWAPLAVSPQNKWHHRPEPGKDFPVNVLVDVKGTEVQFGKPFDFPSYGWDNEYGHRTSKVETFQASKFLASNGEYWHFVSDGGYEKPEYWSETGWRWRSFRNVKHPTFWVPASDADSHQYKLRTCFEIIPMQWNWPVIVNFHEAIAFANWKSSKDGKAYSLISEACHHALRAASAADGEEYRWVPPSPANSNLRWGAESPVDAALTDETLVADLFGNVWQWCKDQFNPLEGFATHPLYADFSTPCFDGEHQMILGGSFVSTGDEASSWARFHFRPHFFQHAGIRLISTL